MAEPVKALALETEPLDGEKKDEVFEYDAVISNASTFEPVPLNKQLPLSTLIKC